MERNILESLKTLALVICATATVWFVLSFSHLDEIGFTSWAMYSSAILPVMMSAMKIAIPMGIRLIVGCVISAIILSATGSLLVFSFEMLIKSMFDSASCLRVCKYPPDMSSIQPLGTRVGFNGERILFGGRCSVKKHSTSGCYLGIQVLTVLNMLNDLALWHETCYQLGWHCLCVCTLGLLYPILKFNSHLQPPPPGALLPRSARGELDAGFLGTSPKRRVLGHLTKTHGCSLTLASFPLSHDLQKIFWGDKISRPFFSPERGRIGAFFSIFRDLQDSHAFAPRQSQNLSIFSNFRTISMIFQDFSKC